MLTRRALNASAVTAAAVVSFSLVGLAAEQTTPISSEACTLARFYDGLDVEHLWPAGVHINWQTGVADGGPQSKRGKHTHCSAFVASIAERLGIYILRPPEHGQTLLANAQLKWLDESGAASGWLSIGDAFAAQAAANKGMFVVASYLNHDPKKPGHIAIVRPSAKSPDLIATEGPDVIQAGLTNYTKTALAIGFAGHPYAWSKAKEVRFYAHSVDKTPERN